MANADGDLNVELQNCLWEILILQSFRATTKAALPASLDQATFMVVKSLGSGLES